ncbi:MAG: sulfur carrier protein ThiS [Candidatus Melainabacteria bacterium]|nr:sulfur carrier protein ThiS [Candidatus Melainabacteria bacterium]
MLAKVIDVTTAIGKKMMEQVCNNSNILIKINGENKSIPPNTSILMLLKTFNINKDRVVIELNKEIIHKDDFNNIHLNDKDKIEIVTLVGGG